MTQNFINPFTEVEQGIESSGLSSQHPYWSNYVKVVKIKESFRDLDKLEKVKDNRHLFDREFSKNTNPETVEAALNKKLSECYGACNSLYYKMQAPSGVVIS